MKRTRLAAAALCLAFLAAQTVTQTPSAMSADLPATAEPAVTFPDTEPGRHARDWFVAFNAGEEAMRAYLRGHVAAEDLARRSIDARIEVWREMRGELGRATARRIIASGPDFVEVAVLGETGAAHSIRFLCRAEPPHTLQGLRVEDAEDEAPHGPGPPGSQAAPPADSGPPPDDATIVASLSAELDSLARAGAFSGVALLDKQGRTLFQRAAGMMDRAARRPNRIDTRFDLGSINKIFTHVAVLQLEQQGKLRLDDTISRYLPDMPAENAGRITIRMLVEHRGGVADVLGQPTLWNDPAAVRTAADWYRLIRDVPLEFEPGTKQRYSNGGYVLLGRIIERVSGEDYYAYVRDHIVKPSGMTDTEHDRLEDRNDRTAVRYTRRPGGGGPNAHDRKPSDARGSGDSLFAEPQRLGRGSSAGGGQSTVQDLVRFARALRDGRLLDAAHRDRLIGPTFRLGIAGGSPGVNALLVIQGPYTLVVLANQDPPAAERFARTTGRQLARATGANPRAERRGGGGS